MGYTIVFRLGLFIVELTKSIVCMNGLCGFLFRDRAKRALLILSMGSFIIISIILAVSPGFKLIDSVYVLLTLIITLFIFQGGKIKTAVVFFISYLCISIFDVFIDIMVTKLLSYFTQVNIEGNIGIILFNCISLLFLFFAAAVKKHRKELKAFPVTKLHWTFYILIIWTLFCFGLMVSYFQIIKKESNTNISSFLILCMITVTMGMVIIIIMITRVSYSRDKYKALSMANQEYLNMQQQYYILLSEKNKDTRRFRHDIKNHLLCMQMLFQENKIEEAKQYLNDVAGGFQEILPKINTGNHVVDAILNDTLTKNSDININVNGCLPYPMRINAMDLCTIFSNTLTNAVEAVNKLENIHRTITIVIKNLEDTIVIHISNPVAKRVSIDGDRVSTSKTDKKSHGFGLENIKRAVEKYRGNMELSCTENEFAVDLIIKNRT
jgi:sensor histidine kinase YesM